MQVNDLDLDLLRKHVADGVVREQRNDTLPLTLYNYSERCQYERLWDDVTLQCRGLVLCDNSIVARPFRKFFNVHEHAEGEIPWHLPCEVTEKLDGSLLIVFSVNGEWYTATRGSFVSEQAQRGAEILARKYGGVNLNHSVTYLFEILYPENRIVVDYGGREDIVLLGMIQTESGCEWSLDDAPDGLSVVRRLPPDADARELRSIIRDDQEGYVVRFANGFRVKIKGERYMELHRIVSGVSSRSIWEALAQGASFDELLAVIPDEFGDWVRQEKSALEAAHAELAHRVKTTAAYAGALPTRKEQAAYILEHAKDISGACFSALDGKDWSGVLWKQLYPDYRRPERMAEVLA